MDPLVTFFGYLIVGGIALVALVVLGGMLAMLGMTLLLILQAGVNALAGTLFWLLRPLLWPARRYPDGPPALLSLKVDDLTQRLQARNTPTPSA